MNLTTATLKVDEITTELRRAINQATSLVFHLDQDGQSYIRCLNNQGKGYGDWDEVRIDCGTRIENNVGIREKYNLGGVRSASHVESHMQFRGSMGHMRTIVDRIRKGDKLDLQWRANNNTGYLDDAGLFQDQLFIQITKPSGKQETFYIASVICPNNTAKMIKNDTSPMTVSERY